MTSLSPIWLVAGLLAVLVVLLHAQRRKTVLVSSTLFFAKLASTEGARPVFKWPKLTLPLVLQVLAILLCALALARPVFTNEAADKHLIYLLDSSASMQATDMPDGQSRFAAAVAKIADEVSALDEADEHRLSLFQLGSTVEPLAVRFENKNDFLQRLTKAPPQSDTANIAGLEQAILGIVRPDERAETILLSDNLDVGFFPTRTFSFGTKAVENSTLSASAEPREMPGRWLVTGTVSYNSAQRPSSITKHFKPHGGRSFVEMGTLPLRGLRVTGDDIKTLDFSVEITLPGPGVLKLSLPGDMAAFDDEILLAIGPPADDVRVLYLGKDDGPVSLALSAIDNLVVENSDVLPENVDDYDIVIAENAILPRAPKTNMIWLGSARVAGEDEPKFVSAATAMAWNSEHQLSQGLSSAEAPVSPAYVWPNTRTSTTLLASNDGALISVVTRPWGRELRIGYIGDGAWTKEADFPILLNRFVDWTGARMSKVSTCDVGAVCTLPIMALSGPVIGPDGNTAYFPVLPDTALVPDAVTQGFVPKVSGIYTFADGREIVVNATRSEPLALTLTDIDDLKTVGRPLWRWILLAAMIILMLEMLVVGLRPDGFLRGTSRPSARFGRRKQFALSGTRLGVVAALAAALFVVPGPSLVEQTKALLLHDWVADACVHKPGLTAQFCVDAQDGITAIAAEQLDDALKLAMASLSPQQSGVLALDWAENNQQGALLHEVAALRESDVQVEVVQSTDEQNDGAFAYFDLPVPIKTGDRFVVSAHVYTPRAQNSTLHLTRNGEPLDTQSVELVQGWTRIAFEPIAAESGNQLLELSWTANDQTHFVSRSFHVGSALKVAIVSPHDDWAALLAEALAVQNLAPEIVSPNETPDELDAWLAYDAVVLLNTPAIALSTEQQEQLEEYVRLHGGGLVLLGGENSFGPGGYFRTPLEDVSPLSARVPEERPVLALAFVLDRSGSMQADVSGMSRLEVAKQATLGAVELLSEDSQVSIVVFDSEGHVISPLAEKDMGLLEAALSTVTPGGGTFFTPGLDLGLTELQRSDAPKRHIILMTDGVSQPGDFVGFAKAAFEDGTSLSVVAIGSGIDTAGLAAIAENGGGAFHSTDDFRALPSILSQEAMMLDNEAMVTGVQPVRWANRDARFLAGLEGPLPPIQGFVKTTLKPGATLHLEARDGDGKDWPVLASWQHGNGQVVAFATHGMGEGTAHWLGEVNLPLLWAQAIRQTSQSEMRAQPLSVLQMGNEVEVVSRDGLPSLSVSIDAGEWRDVALRLRDDGTSVARIPARPGHYQFAALDDVQATASLSVPALQNPMQAQTDIALLAELTGGRVLTAGEMPQSQWGIGIKPLWREWVLLGLAAFMAELAARYAPGLLKWRWRQKQKQALATN